jgi:hypothetical protein
VVRGVDDEHARPGDAGLVVVAAVRVAPPLTEPQAKWLASLDLLADTAETLRTAWASVEAMWETTVADALARQPDELDERVNGEWSFAETLRHLVLVIDAWIGVGVLGRTAYHPLGVPPHFLANPRELGLDLDATPTMEEVLAVREEQLGLVRDTLATLADVKLMRRCRDRFSDFLVLGAFQNVIAEEVAHHAFAIRDLGILRSRHRDDTAG